MTATENDSSRASWLDKVLLRIRGLKRSSRILIVAVALAAIVVGLFITRPTDHEPNPVRLEMAGDRGTLDAIFAGHGPALGGSATPLKCEKEATSSDDRELSVKTSHTTETPAGSTSRKFEASLKTNSSATTTDSSSCPTPRPSKPMPANDDPCKGPAGQAREACWRKHARDDVDRDWIFIALYGLAGLAVCSLGGLRARTGSARAFLFGGAAAAVAAALFDIAEDIFLIHALDHPASTRWPLLTTMAATVKWSLVVVFAIAFVLAVVTLLRSDADRRDRVTSRRPRMRRRDGLTSQPPGTPRHGVDIPALDRCKRYDVQGQTKDDHGKIGVCFSGGGIRSASFSLGVMQRLQEPAAHTKKSLFSRARYLSAVSGGGYIAGAAQLHQSLDPNHALPFRPGSAEEDHLRRHGNYLADGAGEWANAIGQLLGKLLGNLILITLAVIVAAQPLGWLGRFFLGAQQTSVDPLVGSWPSIPMYAVAAIAILGLPALVLATAHRGHALPRAGGKQLAARRSGLAVSIAIGFGLAAGFLALTAVVLPLLNSLGHWIAGALGHPTGAVAAAWPTAIVAALLGKVNINALGRETTGGAAPADPTATKPKATGVAQYWEKGLAELVAGPAIVLAVLAYVTAFAAQARSGGARGTFVRVGGWAADSLLITAVGLAIVLVAVFSIDAVNWSMHRFYKRRLWSAFTYDHDDHDDDDHDDARRWSTPTRLSSHATRIDGRPELVLCGAAQVSGPDVAPPGHRAVSWTFTSEWIGGPEIGWCATSAMEDALAKRHWDGDVSMFGAIAICGAAFGSAMGRQSMGTLNSVFAITNARLGVWLPNPRDVENEDFPPGRFWQSRRDLRYWIHEIFGRYSPRGRFVLVSDGGHYENLGLVELFRRRCMNIVCVDASGDASGALTTVAQAIRLAQQELGVTFELPSKAAPPSDDDKKKDATKKTVEKHESITVHETIERHDASETHDSTSTRDSRATHDKAATAEPELNAWDNAPGGGKLTQPPDAVVKAVAERVAKHAVTTIKFSYPPEAGMTGDEQGTLVIGRAVLDPTTPLDVVSYAVGNGSFPNDSTGDQWFDADQFDDYRILGYHLGGQINALTADWR